MQKQPRPQQVASDFRLDINGLRAWAVLSVVLFHFKVPGFSGGFVGVDIFFVISGYLMTRLLLGQGDQPIAIGSFYLARARRIVPALLALIVCLMVLGALYVPSPDFRTLGSHSAAASMFVSNIKFWTESGYFDSASDEKWLLHTWSLSVEWQFYLVYPVMLKLAQRLRGSRGVSVVLWAGTALSMTVSIYWATAAPSAGFYLLPARAWEMLLGGLVYTFAPVVWTDAGRARLERLGFVLLLGSLVLIDEGFAWPGGWAMFPVVGTALVLLAKRSDSIWTALPPAQWLGTHSYSIYLWHWPVVVAWGYAGVSGGSMSAALGIVCSVALGWLSYRLVEVRAQRWMAGRSAAVIGVGLLVLLVVTAGAGVLVRLLDGIPQRLSPLVERVAAQSDNKRAGRNRCYTLTGIHSPQCVVGGPEPGAIVIGDSHADALITAVAAAAPHAGLGVLDLSYVRCPTLFGVKASSGKFEPGENCGGFLDQVSRELEHKWPGIPLIIINRTSLYVHGYNEVWERERMRPPVYFSEPHSTADRGYLDEFSARMVASVCTLARARPVYLMRPVPEMPLDVPKVVARGLALGQLHQVRLERQHYFQRHRAVISAQDQARDQCGAQILDPLPYLCDDQFCHGQRDGLPLYYDDDHLNEWGNKWLVPMFRPVFQDLSLKP